MYLKRSCKELPRPQVHPALLEHGLDPFCRQIDLFCGTQNETSLIRYPLHLSRHEPLHISFKGCGLEV